MPFYPDDAPYYGWWGTSQPWYGHHCYPHEHYTEVPANYDKRVALQHKTKEFLNSTVPWLMVKATRDEEFLTQTYYLDLNLGVFREQAQSALKPVTDKLQDNIDAEAKARSDEDNAQKAEYTKFYNENKEGISNNNRLIQSNTDKIAQEQAQRVQADNELKEKNEELKSMIELFKDKNVKFEGVLEYLTKIHNIKTQFSAVVRSGYHMYAEIRVLTNGSWPQYITDGSSYWRLVESQEAKTEMAKHGSISDIYRYVEIEGGRNIKTNIQVSPNSAPYILGETTLITDGQYVSEPKLAGNYYWKEG